MRYLRLLIVLLIWLAPAILVGWLVYHMALSNKLSDGSYVIGNSICEWRFTVKDGVFQSKELRNRSTGETLPLTGSELRLTVGPESSLGWIEKDGKSICTIRQAQEITLDKCLPVNLTKNASGACVDFCYGPLQLVITLRYSFDKRSPYIHRQVEVQNMGSQQLVLTEAVLGEWKTGAALSGGGQGLPVFAADKWFLSGEQPWTIADVNDTAVSLRHYPGAVLPVGSGWQSDSVILGGGAKKSPRLILRDYVRSQALPPVFASLYNTWCDYREDQLTSANTMTVYKRLADAIKAYGASLDYCVVDDGWFRKDSIYKTNDERFPKGLYEVSSFAREYGGNLGLWLSYSSMMSDHAALEKAGYESPNIYYFCAAGPKYNADLRTCLKKLIENDSVRFFKHDFNYFVCQRQDHGHMSTLEEGTEANMRATAGLLDFERAESPEVRQAITTGINLSPWWLKYAGVLWMGGKDKEYDYSFPVTSAAMAEMNKRDALLYEILVRDRTFLPLHCLMTHGIMDGLLDKAGPWKDSLQWGDYVMNYLGRGTGLRELYLHPNNLSDEKTRILGRGLNWAARHNGLMENAVMILGDPGRNELYGFRGTDEKGRAYVSLRNPTFLDKTIKLSDVAITTEYYRVSYPYHVVYATKDKPALKIPAESVVIVESLRLADQQYPTAINIRSERQTVTGKSLKLSVTPSADDPPDILIYSPFKLKGLVGLHDVRPVNKHMWAAKRPIVQDSRRVTFETQPTMGSNDFLVSFTIPENAEADLVWTVFDPKCGLKLAIDSVPECKSKPATMTDSETWQLRLVHLPAGTHTVRGQISDTSKTVTLSDLSLRVTYMVPLYEVQVTHALSRGQDPTDYHLPQPLVQDKFQETIPIFTGEQFRTARNVLYEDVQEAVLEMDINDVNGGDYDRKQLFLNGYCIGLLPCNKPPISSWQRVSIQVPQEAFYTIGSCNTLAIMDETGDFYKIRHIRLAITRKSAPDKPVIQRSKSVFTNARPSQWLPAEGTTIPVDGTPSITLFE